MAEIPVAPSLGLDTKVLTAISPGFPDLTEKDCTVLFRHACRCNFVLHLPKNIQLVVDGNPHQSFYVCLSMKVVGNFERICARQNLARTQIPDHVAPVFKAGRCKNMEGVDIEYCVTPLAKGSVVLEEVWDDVSPQNLQSLAHELGMVMTRLQGLPYDTDRARVVGNIWREDVYRQVRVPPQDTAGIEAEIVHCIGPFRRSHYGQVLVEHEKKLTPTRLEQILKNHLTERASELCDVFVDQGDVIIWSDKPVKTLITFTQSDLDALHDSVVFCHNDLEPYSIVVNKDSGGIYRLASINNWGRAGFDPFAYELSIKDCDLGYQGLWFSWYSLFRQETRGLLPDGVAHKKLIDAIRLVAHFNNITMPRNNIREFWIRWMRREKLCESEDVTRGYIRRDDAGDVPVFKQADMTASRREIMVDWGMIGLDDELSGWWIRPRS